MKFIHDTNYSCSVNIRVEKCKGRLRVVLSFYDGRVCKGSFEEFYEKFKKGEG